MNKQEQKKEKKYLRKAVGMIITLIGVFLLLFLMFYAFSRFFRPQEFATMLPHDSVVSLVQVNIDENNDQVKTLSNSLSGYSLYDIRLIKTAINEFLDVDFNEDIMPWLKRQIGFAVIENPAGKGQTSILVFVEVKDKEKAIEFMRSRGLQNQEDYIISDNYKGTDIYKYSLSQTYNFIFINGYMIIATTDIPLKTVIDTVGGQNKKLIDNSKYQKVAQNLPINSIVFAYADIQKAMEVLSENELFMSEKGREMLAFKPFIDMYKSAGLTLAVDHNTLAMQSFIALDREYFGDQDFISFDNKFRASLVSFLPGNTVFYAGGLNLQKQLYKYSELFNNGSEVSYLIFEGALRYLVSSYLGEEIVLEEDIYPLLDGEYAFAYVNNDRKSAYVGVLELDDPVADKELIEAIAESFIRKSAILAPKVVQVELEDGTAAEEIQVTPEEITKSMEDYHGYEMNILKIGNQNWGIEYIVLDDYLVITTQKEALQEVIDLFIDSGESLKQSSVYSEMIVPVMKSSDEVIYFDLSYFSAIFKDNYLGETALYLEPFKYLSAGKNYFKDGIVAITYIKID